MTTHPHQLVAVIATGGTIASRRGAGGTSTPALGAYDLLALFPAPSVGLRLVDLMAKDSSTLTLRDMQRVSDAVGEQLADDAVDGVVVLHGTDSMEETALLVDLQHRSPKPVVFTGAQRTADHPQPDGPRNFAAAIRAVTDHPTGEQAVLIAFGERLLPAWTAYKHSTDESDAFRAAGSRPATGSYDTAAGSQALGARPHLPASVADVRIDIVAIHPGGDALHLEASLRAGANGVVLAALGSGNASPAVVEGVRRCSAAGVPVVVSSRVPEGPLVASYGGGGGGSDLAAAGAIHSRTLRPGQARILLAALCASGRTRSEIAAAFGGGPVV